MISKQAIRSGLLGTCAIGAAAAFSPAHAQVDAKAASPDDIGVNIVVNALKQNEALLDTPATVKVIDDSALEVANVTNAEQLGGIVPGYFAMKGTFASSASFRGLGSGSADPTIESSVGTFVDGIYLGHVRDFVIPLYDTKQIEFIAGTQSTVLGRNTSLGAVSIATRRPGRDFGVDLAGTYTSEIEGFRFEGGVDVPLGERFAVRLAGFVNDERGFVRNAFSGGYGPDLSEQSGRIVLDGDLGETTRLTAIYQHDRRRVKGTGLELLLDGGDVGGAVQQLIDFGELDDSGFEGNPNDVVHSGGKGIFGNDDGPLPFDTQDGDRATLILEHGFGDGMKLTAQSGYVDWESERVADLDFTSARLFDLFDTESNEVFSQELRLASNNDGKLSWSLGGFYYWNNYSLRRVADVFVDFDGDGNPVLMNLTALDGTVAVKTSSWSVFASGRYELSDQFAVRGGIRQTWENKTATYSVDGFLTAPIAPGTVLPTSKNRETDGNVGIEFRPADNVMIYASWGRGSKNGGYQSTPDSIATAAYGPEAAYSWEAGSKFDFGGGSFLELAVFDTRVKNFQASRIVNLGGQFPETQISNVDARSTGAELSSQWKVSDKLKLTGNVTYANSRFVQDLFNLDENGDPIALEIPNGQPLPRAPRWQGTVGADFTNPLSDNLTLKANAVVRFASDADLQMRFKNPDSPKTQGGAYVDLRLALASDQGWEIAVQGNNLFDRRTATFASGAPLAQGNPAYFGTRNRPRTIAVQLKFTR